MIWWTGLAPGEFEFLGPGSHIFTFLAHRQRLKELQDFGDSPIELAFDWARAGLKWHKRV